MCSRRSPGESPRCAGHGTVYGIRSVPIRALPLNDEVWRQTVWRGAQHFAATQNNAADMVGLMPEIGAQTAMQGQAPPDASPTCNADRVPDAADANRVSFGRPYGIRIAS